MDSKFDKTWDFVNRNRPRLLPLVAQMNQCLVHNGVAAGCFDRLTSVGLIGVRVKHCVSKTGLNTLWDYSIIASPPLCLPMNHVVVSLYAYTCKHR